MVVGELVWLIWGLLLQLAEAQLAGDRPHPPCCVRRTSIRPAVWPRYLCPPAAPQPCLIGIVSLPPAGRGAACVASACVWQCNPPASPALASSLPCPALPPPCPACREEGGLFRFCLPLEDLVNVQLQPEIYFRWGSARLQPTHAICTPQNHPPTLSSFFFCTCLLGFVSHGRWKCHSPLPPVAIRGVLHAGLSCV